MSKLTIQSPDMRRDFPVASLNKCGIKSECVRNGLVVRMPNHLGDAVMALPALEALKKILPRHCALFVIAPEYQRQLYDALPAVSGAVLLKKMHRFWSRKELTTLRGLRAGIGLLMNNSLRDAICMRLALVPKLFGVSRRGRGVLLTRRFNFKPLVPGKYSGQHQANRYSAMAEALGAEPWSGELPHFRFRLGADELAARHAALCTHPLLLTLAPGAAYGAAKRWPAEKFRVIAEYWVRHGGIVAVLGSSSESRIGSETLRGLSAAKCFNLCGDTDLQTLMMILRNSAFTVANDSGLMHLSAALGRPGIAMFGPTDFTDTGPISSKWTLICSKYPCAPCRSRVCPSGAASCMAAISALAVLRQLRRRCLELKIPLRPASKRYEVDSASGGR